jgi:hypothetical protein
VLCISKLQVSTLLIGILAVSSRLCAQAPPFKAIDNPGGGKIVYGVVEGQASEAGAIGAVLRSMHQQYGDRPTVGKPFKVSGSNSAAVFFTLVKRNQDGAQVAGLVIASQTGPGRVEAALLSDEATRFGRTINPMMKSLFAVWHPGAERTTVTTASAAAPAQALIPYVLPDRSASVELPSSWKVQPSSGGGTIIADGPNGEAVALDIPLLAMNSNDPHVRQTMAYAQGAGRNTAYARGLYYPYGGDLGKMFVDLLQMKRRMSNQPALTMEVERETPMNSAPGSRCAHLEGKSDPHDGKGTREFVTVFCSGPLARMGSYMNIVFHTAVPVAIAAQQRATMGAILASFQINQGVVANQAAALAAPAIAQIHAVGRAVDARIAATHEAEDIHNRSVEARWDSLDKGNQAFSNYLLDQSVISNTENGGHATVWNQTAQALVQNNPSRFSYVDTPNFWKGIDY